MQTVAAMYPSQYRKYLKLWNEAYAVNPEYFNDSGFRWLAKHAKRVGGSYKISNGMIFRVFFPIYIEPALPSDIEITLDKAGYHADKSYEYCTDKHGRKVAVGKAYQQLAKKSGESEETIKSSLEKYSEILGSTGAMMLCVSRHPYDIAGMSTGRAWKSCHTLGGDTPYDKVQRKKALVRYYNELEKYHDALDDYEKEMEVYRDLEAELYPQRVKLEDLRKSLGTKHIFLKRAYLDLESNALKQFIENVHARVFDFVSDSLDVDVPSELTGVLTESIKLAMQNQARQVCRMELIGEAVPDVPATELPDYVEDGLFGSYHTLFFDALSYYFISTCKERGLDVPKYSDFFAYVRSMANTSESESEPLNTLYSAAVPQAISNDIRSAARELVPKLIEIYKEKAETIVKYEALRAQLRASYPVEQPEEPEQPDDSPVKPGSYSGLVEQDVVTGSVIAYVIKPKANLLTSLESAKRINPKMVELLEKKLDKSNKDPIFEPRGRVILRTANRRYLRAGKVYGFSDLPEIKEQFSAMARVLTVALNKARKRDYGILEPISHYRERRDVTYSEGDERGDAKLNLDRRSFFPSEFKHFSKEGKNADLFSEYDDSDFQDEFGYDRDEFLEGLSDYVSRRVALALPEISTWEHTDLVFSLVSKVSSVPLKDVVKRMSFLLNRLKPPYAYQVGVNSLPVGFLVERFCENPDYSNVDDPDNIAYYLPANLTSFGNPGDLNKYPVFVEHRSRNYADLEPDIAYLSSLRDMLIAANSFPGKPYIINQLVFAILETGTGYYARSISDMVDQGISPVDQFKLILIDYYDQDFDSAISQQYLAPGVPDFFNS